MEKQIEIGIGDPISTASGFIDAWKRAEIGEVREITHRLYFENLEILLKTLTSARWLLLKRLRSLGAISIRALARELGRDYKNVHTDVKRLEKVGLIERTEMSKIEVPWDILEARLKLAA